MKKQFKQYIFCAPTGEYENFSNYPSRLTESVFEILQKAGIRGIFGFGYDTREETIQTTALLCEKHGLKYYPTLPIFGRYIQVADKDGQKAFCNLSAKELQELDADFVSEIKKLEQYPAFGGIFFSDEQGFLAHEGIAYAKNLFDKHFQGYEFHYNFFSYSIDEPIFWGGMNACNPENKPFLLEGELEIKFENRFIYYDKLVEDLESRADFEYMSQDKYPFENFWDEVPNSVHVALFELNAYFAQKKKKYGNKFYNYMQVGNWDGSSRQMTRGEMALQMHVTTAYGADGFAYFPGCFPLDWINQEYYRRAENGDSALIDAQGNATVYATWIGELNTFFREIEEDILDSSLLGVTEFGNYDNGFTETFISTLPDNECIFRGKLPDMLRHTPEGVKLQSINGVMLATFQRDNKKRYYVVNLSSVYKNEIKLQLPVGKYICITEREKMSGVAFALELGAGEGAYIIEE